MAIIPPHKMWSSDSHDEVTPPILRYFKISDHARAPLYGSEKSACFDLHACLPDGCTVKVRDSDNQERKLVIHSYLDGEVPVPGRVVLPPLCKALIPTGLIFDIPEGYSVRLHPRSGNAWKEALTLVNSEGVVDSDYVDPTFAAVINLSDIQIYIEDGQRICQAELVPVLHFEVEETLTQPVQKTNRAGGFGSTGK